MRDILDQDQRLVILRSLVECGDSANESILQTCLQTYGHRVSRDTVRTHLAWLREQGLVSLTDVSGCYVAEITGRQRSGHGSGGEKAPREGINDG